MILFKISICEETIMYRLVIFDLDDTLIDFSKYEEYAIKFMFKRLNIEYKDCYYPIFSKIDSELWSMKKYENIDIKSSDIPIKRFEIYFNKLKISNVNTTKANELFMEGLIEGVFEIPESHEILNYLKNKNYMICIATNGIINLQKTRLLKTSFSKYIDQIVVSEEVGENKPSPKIFLKILKDNNVGHEEAIIIGDSLSNDIIGAKNIGITSVWYNPLNKLNQTNISPDYQISNLLELKNIL